MQPGSTNPIYLDWTFWSFVTAAVAAVLSQLPPLRDFFSKAVLRLEVHPTSQITHMVGYPNMSLFMVVRNLGKRPARIVRLVLEIERSERLIATLPSQNYFVGPHDEKPVIFVPFTLPPGEERAHTFLFFAQLPEHEDRKVGSLRARLKRDVFGKVHEKKRVDPNNNELVESDPEIASSLLEIYKQQFLWAAGEFRLRLKLVAEDETLSQESSFRFTVFEAQEADLRSYADKYRHGFGAAFDDPEQAGVFVRLIPT